MENRTELLDIALNFLKAKKRSTFVDIWKHVKKELNIPEELEEKTVGNLYTGMVLDTHFFLKSDKFWYPRSDITLDEIKTQVSSIQEAIEDRDGGDDDIDIDITATSENDDSIDILEDKYGDGDSEEDDTRDIDNALTKFKLKEEFGD